ncbi:MAG: CotH kinase family protein, partial [Verrucomicrobiota bacterium]
LDFQIQAVPYFGPSAVYPTGAPAGAPAESYLCYFGCDTGYTGEYDTYHIFMKQANRTELETRGDGSNVLLDGTFITAEGKIVYNCGVRYRGNSSRFNPYNFRIEMPRGEKLDGLRDINLNHVNALQQYMGMKIQSRVGFGNVAPRVKLCRLWLNQTEKSAQAGEDMYVRVQKLDANFIADHYPDDTGNIYRGGVGPDKGGTLDYRATIPEYDNERSYRVETNNPVTVWHELQDLTLVLAQDPSTYPTILTQRVNVRQWARHYATHFAMDNREGGLCSPASTTGDDYAIFADPVDNRFDFLPWDMDTVIRNGNTTRNVWNSYGLSQIVQDFLFNPPIVPWFIGDIGDILHDEMSDENMIGLLNEMGSVVTAGYSNNVMNYVQGKRTFIDSFFNRDLTVSAGGFPASDNYMVVNAGSVTLSGEAPQAYTAEVRVNGSPAFWQTRSNRWATVGPVGLNPGA